MKNFLVRLSIAAPIVGGVLVILLLIGGGPTRSGSPTPSAAPAQSGTNASNTSIASANQGSNPSPAIPPNINWTSLVIVLVGFVLLGAQTWANFFRQWYDPTLALKYWDWFQDEEQLKMRREACRYYLKHKSWNIDIEDTLDLLDDLGFYVQTLHVSALYSTSIFIGGFAAT